MQRLEVSGAVRPIFGSLGVKRLRTLLRKLVNACVITSFYILDDRVYLA